MPKLCAFCGKEVPDGAITCPHCRKGRFITPKKPSSEAKGAGTPKAGVGWWAAIASIPFMPILIKFVPIIVGLVVWGTTKNGFWGLSVFLGLAAWLWNIQGGLKTTLIAFACILFFIGIPAIKEGLTNLSIVYGKDIRLSLSSGWRTVTRGISCTWCQATYGLMNPEACEEKCELDIISTEPLLDYSYEIPGIASQRMPIPVDATVKLLALEETVKNLAVDIWIVNETDCGGDYCIPEEMFACPQRSECLKIVEMPCGDGVKCECQNNPCELNKDNSEKTITVWLHNPTCHRKKDISLFPRMKIEYEFTAKTFHKVRVAKSEAALPVQEEKKSVGPISIKMKTDKEVYILEKMAGGLATGTLTIRVSNTGDGYSYMKNIALKQEHAEEIEPFKIKECPGFKLEENDGEAKLSLEEGKTIKLGPRGDWTLVSCAIDIPSKGIRDFNEYTFSSFVTYKYKETEELTPILLDCGQAKA